MVKQYFGAEILFCLISRIREDKIIDYFLGKGAFFLLKTVVEGLIFNYSKFSQLLHKTEILP